MLKFDGKENGCSFSYTFNQGEHTSESYLAYTDVCQNPVCICNIVHINFVPQKDIESDDKQVISYNVSLEVVSKSIASDTKGKINENFANSLVKDFSEKDWDSLYQYYFSKKVFATEAADLTTVDVAFPVEDIEYESRLISYIQIIPYSRPVILTLENNRFLVDDMYCVKPNCHCNEAHLIFIPYDKPDQIDATSKQENEDEAYITLNLKNHSWVVKEQGQGSINTNTLMRTFFEKKELVELYKTRYKTLRLLYIKYRSTINQNNTIRASNKVSRNDPCPCGSGKKYKKCCL